MMFTTTKKTALMMFVAGAMASLSTGTQAADSAIINVHGKILATTCQVNGGTTNPTIDIDMGTVAAADFDGTAGSTAGHGQGAIAMTGCDSELNGVTVTATGTPDASYSDAYKNDNGTTDVGVKLTSGGTLLKNGANLNVTIDKTSHAATIPLVAEMVATGAAVPEAGDVASVVTLNLAYN